METSRPLRHLLALALAACAGAAHAQPAPTPTSTYDDPAAWLCRPGRADACGGEQAVTRIAADGSRSVQVLAPRADAPIDCFYVYPTISEDPNPNSTLAAGPGERRAVAQQFAPFASVCRPYAPMYRQVTLAGLRSVMGGQPAAIDTQRPVEDVRAAWRHYLAHDNQGRGVVLVGHSQGARMLRELLQRDIEGQPVQKRLVSALLVGSNVVVPAGAAAAGSLPLCGRAGQPGCIVSYASFRDTAPPPANARFGRASQPGTEVACTDPVALSGQPLQALLPRTANLLGQPATREDWQQAMADVATPFVDLPGLLGARCVKDGASHFLAVRVDAAARGSRPADIPVDLVAGGRLYDDWGLHLADVNLVLGNLLALVRQQGAGWAAGQR